MSLTIYDPEQNCQVLNPEEFKPEIINAFHPDYMKTYHPNFTKEFWTAEANQAVREEITKSKPPSKFSSTKNKKPAVKKPVVKKEPMTMSEIRDELDEKKRQMLLPRMYTTYAKAGIGNVKPKGKKK